MRINISQLRKRCKMTKPPGVQVGTQDRPLWYIDNDSDILAIAHLDYVPRTHHFETMTIKPDNGRKPHKVVLCGQLDNRLGAYVILDLLPTLGLKYDILLTTDEEKCQSTAMHFETDKKYRWIFSFDREGLDVVQYQYETKETTGALASVGAKLGTGSYSDIRELNFLGCAGFNWGNGLQAGHSVMAHVALPDLVYAISQFVTFYHLYSGTHFKHTQARPRMSKLDWRAPCEICGRMTEGWSLTDAHLCATCADDWIDYCDACGQEKQVEPYEKYLLCEACALAWADNDHESCQDCGSKDYDQSWGCLDCGSLNATYANKPQSGILT